jgi:alpha-beta hydrolase superfamily lysophospholipase
MALLRERYPGVPLFVMGESMGAAVAVLAANRGGPGAADGFILLAPAVWGRSTMNVFERMGLWVADLFPGVEWSPRALPVTIRPSDNVAMLRELFNDPLVIKTARSDTLNGLVDLMGAALDAAPRFTAPALILYGEQDAVVPRTPVARFVAALPHDAAERQRVALYPAGYHLLLRDLEGPMVTADVLAWIENSRAPLPSGADRDARARLEGQKRPANDAPNLSAAEPAS